MLQLYFNTQPRLAFAVISRRGDVRDVTSGATYSLLGVFFSFYLSFFLSFFIPRVISAITHPIFVIFVTEHVSCLGVSNAGVGFQISYVLFVQDAKTAQKMLFLRFFRWVTSRFLPLRKNGLS